MWALALLALLLLFNLAFTPHFFRVGVLDGRLYGSLIDILVRGTPVALLSLGMALVIGSGGVDLSVGAVMAIAGTVAACLIARPADSPLAAVQLGSAWSVIAFALAAALVCGLFNGILVSIANLQPIVATLLLMVAGRGIAQLLADGQIVTFHSPAFAALSGGSLLAVPMPIWIFVGMAFAVGLLARKTALGLFIEAIGSNRVAARMAGIDIKSTILAVYAISGLCAGLAGLIVTADIRAADANNAGLYLELDAILAVAVGGASITGGRFTLWGAIIGSFLMQTLTTTMLTRGLSPEFALICKALLVVAVCLMQSPQFRSVLRRRAA